ncbi:hypothetical protein [Kocuria massiliensis]|uniref:hypothetical protein n=1 Tax=Kocuria massiliensis TaxID=1926282 RepID=UPI0022B9D3D7|nr:hypothetical protein [Kocuria massiliensis]
MNPPDGGSGVGRRWVLSSHSIGIAEELSLWKRIRREYDAHDGPGSFLLTIDGRSGSGKSRLAERLLRRARQETGHDVEIFHLEDLYPGWDGLASGIEAYAAMVARLLDDRDAPWRAWDWQRNAPEEDERVVSARTPFLILEGVGASAPGHPGVEGHFGVWLSLDSAVRRHRALRRDGDLYRPYWEMWAAQEAELFDRRG